MSKKVSDLIMKKDYVLDKISFEANDYFRFVGNAELSIIDALKTKNISKDEFIVSVGRTISSETENLFKLSVCFDVHFVLTEDADELQESDVDLYLEENYQEFTNICMAKISLLISQVTAQLGRGVPIITSPYFTQDIDD